MTKTNRSPTARLLADAIEASGKTQRQIAKDIGYAKPNVLSMMKHGDTRIPLEKIPALARACGVDEQLFMRTALLEYHPAAYGTLMRTFWPRRLQQEEDWLSIWQLATINAEIQIDSQLVGETLALLDEAHKRRKAR